MKFTFENLLEIYKKIETKYGDDSFNHLSEVLELAKSRHKAGFTGNEHGQSWRAFKGKNLEKLIKYIIADRIGKLGLAMEDGNKLERTNSNNLTKVQCKVKRNLLIDYGEYGHHFPDVDIVVYKPESGDVIALLSIKVSLRERVAQTGYWCLKLRAQDYTKTIKVFFVTLDEDGDFANRPIMKKGRVIAETDTDGVYILSTEKFEASKKVKLFSQLIVDLQKSLN